MLIISGYNDVVLDDGITPYIFDRIKVIKSTYLSAYLQYKNFIVFINILMYSPIKRKKLIDFFHIVSSVRINTSRHYTMQQYFYVPQIIF